MKRLLALGFATVLAYGCSTAQQISSKDRDYVAVIDKYEVRINQVPDRKTAEEFASHLRKSDLEKLAGDNDVVTFNFNEEVYVYPVTPQGNILLDNRRKCLELKRRLKELD